ncbi:hypothetical protein GGI25_003595 [Coemansia spiralis]|uniref:RING-type E3 ubiquitin transferase n=1 Tax=Coemansia spiralis TaxID=417178 RepID=A0A9W8G5R7_9FUNG|nr:hypothetical protein BX070DRAFT_226759 [Coemansia spiralis]KAJ2676445.1 hypothetical protein GGI25_003595 [Coemansia spiralis]
MSNDNRSQDSCSIDENIATDDDYACPICLQPITQKCYTDPCYHQFCLYCLLQWAEHYPRCPLCNTSSTAAIQLVSGKITKIPLQWPQHYKNSRYAENRQDHYGRDPCFAQIDAGLGMRKRKAVYEYKLRRTINTATGARRTHVIQIPELLKSSIDAQRCRLWIRRDLQVILNTSDVDLVELLIISLVKQTGKLDFATDTSSPSVSSFLGDKTNQFQDELCAFIESSLDIYSYDRYVAYDTRE